MDTLRNLYKIGNGPSSSHTMGPKIAAETFKSKNKDATKFEVELYGSLASTGKGHLTDFIIKQALGMDITNIIFREDIVYKYHSNGMLFKAFKGTEKVDEWLVFSVGGGELKNLNEDRSGKYTSVYKHTNMSDILVYCNNKNISFYDYVIENEGIEILEYANKVIEVMFNSIEQGIKKEGVLPGNLHVLRRAKNFYDKYLEDKGLTTLAFASSLAVAEENASGAEIVTAPTCGASGVLPGVLYTYYKCKNIDMKRIKEGLLVGGLIGNIIKHNGSISGAEVGCQGEVGAACSMAAAAITYIEDGTNEQIEYASEIALEHHLGLTCDPVQGYVQIPCIERNAMSCKRAIDACNFALLTDGRHYIHLDDAIKTMLETGHDLNANYKETSLGGLAKTKVC